MPSADECMGARKIFEGAVWEAETAGQDFRRAATSCRDCSGL